MTTADPTMELIVLRGCGCLDDGRSFTSTTTALLVDGYSGLVTSYLASRFFFNKSIPGAAKAMALSIATVLETRIE